MIREYLTFDEAENFFTMLKSLDLDIVHLALDMILNSHLYLPYRYNDQGEHRLKAALEATTPDIKPYVKWNDANRVFKHSDALKKRLNQVRAKQTLPWSWRLIE